MKLHPVYGPSLPEKGWVPAPSYLLRRDLVLKRLEGYSKQRLLEIGSGPAVLLYELALAGWECSALEQSEAALDVARWLHKKEEVTNIFEEPQDNWKGHFDWLLAMEVLEHIEEDLLALEAWRTWLAPGGRILLSVPAHEKKWSASDVWAGHYRRYEKNSLISLVEQAGFLIEEVSSYGFPLSNMIEPLRAMHHSRLLRNNNDQQQLVISKREGSDQSGTTRSLEKQLYPLYSNFFGTSLMKTAFWLQQKFLDTNLGTGYLVQARRVD